MGNDCFRKKKVNPIEKTQLQLLKKHRKNKKKKKQKRREVVYNKVKQMTTNYSKMSSADLFTLVSTLSDTYKMQEMYLDPESLGKSLSNFDQYENNMYEYDSDNEEEIGSEEIKIQIKTKNVLRLPVKFIITEMIHSNMYKTLRNLISPILSKIPRYRKEFGMFHTSIIIGPWYLEWTDSSLIIPRKLYSNMALLSADIETGALLKNKTFDDISASIAEVVCRWNNSKFYCNVNLTKNEKMGNCQEFVEDVMQSLGITLGKGDGAFWDFLNKMKKRGQCKMEFSPSDEFREKFKVDKKYTFDSHQELDIFVNDLSKKSDICLQIDYGEVFRLLKSFDRAFWLRHIKKPYLVKFKPLNCPFEDPRKTKSYMTYS